ncbi:hypothetical protein LCGC14_1948750 [marine sediment metagenome]|uniref:TRASH domain-containing protein n=1 Tax=marine sediment metagenome TaxID=412755 RepID=A0A0F9FI02_9ZZZZ
MQCEICNKRINHPVRRGRKSRFCGFKCRAKHKKEWRRVYDAQKHIKKKKSKRELARYYRNKLEELEE